MAEKTVLIVGASGDVGRGIVSHARTTGWNVVAVARNAERLADIAGSDSGIAALSGDLSSDTSAKAMWDAAIKIFGGIDAVVVSVNVATGMTPLTELTSEAMAGFYANNVLTHAVAARNFLPKLAADGVFLGIGGGTADFIIPKMVPISMAQAALRMFYKGLARENREGAAVRELMIISMVHGASNRGKAPPEWLTDAQIGEHVCAILADPAGFAGPVLQLKTADQVGKADA